MSLTEFASGDIPCLGVASPTTGNTAALCGEPTKALPKGDNRKLLRAHEGHSRFSADDRVKLAASGAPAANTEHAVCLLHCGP